MKVLIIDDEKNVRRILGDYLKNEGYEVIFGVNGEDGIDQVIAHKDIDLILLDVRMPKLDGFEAIKEIKEITDAPVMFITALDETFDEIKGLDLGADDYITKPFNYKVLTARVSACLRKNNRHKKESQTFGLLTIDFARKDAKIHQEPCQLTIKEFELLEYLVNNRDMSLERLRILDRVWGYDYEGDPRTVDTHVKTLRAKLGEASDYVKTVRGVGYRFEIED